VQGERELAKDCRSLARFTLRGIPPMPAGMARLEVHFAVDENGLLRVRAVELTTGIEQQIEVVPSYGLTDEQIEDMLIDAIDHGDEDLEARRLADGRVEGQRILLATRKALDTDADLLSADERAAVDGAEAALRDAVATATRASAVQRAIEELDRVTHDWAGRRMDRAMKAAIAGKRVGDVAAEVERAAGVDAHVAAHEAARAVLPPER